jgi:hypothetical protein
MLPSTLFLRNRIDVLQDSRWFKRTIALIQGLSFVWIMIQRAYDGGHPSTLLEFNTLIQVLLPLPIHFIWWQKPQGIEEPIEIDFHCCPACLAVVEANELRPHFSDDPPWMTLDPTDGTNFPKLRAGESFVVPLWLLGV